jgi:hypothetical protein
MNPPELFDAGGQRVPDRRHSHGRRSEDELAPELLLGYERWAGHVWAHRGKIAAMIGMAGSLAGCVVGYFGRAHDLDDMKLRVARVETRLDSAVADVRELTTSARIQNITLCSLSRRLDPAGTPAECGPYLTPTRHP